MYRQQAVTWQLKQSSPVLAVPSCDCSAHLCLEHLDQLALLLEHECVVLLDVLLGQLVQLNLLLQLRDAAERLVLRRRQRVLKPQRRDASSKQVYSYVTAKLWNCNSIYYKHTHFMIAKYSKYITATSVGTGLAQVCRTSSNITQHMFNSSSNSLAAWCYPELITFTVYFLVRLQHLHELRLVLFATPLHLDKIAIEVFLAHRIDHHSRVFDFARTFHVCQNKIKSDDNYDYSQN